MGLYRKGNRWYTDIYLPGCKRKREVVKIDGVDPSKITLRDAEKVLSIRRAEVAQGNVNIAPTGKAISFEQLMSRYLDWAKDNHDSFERDVAASKPLLHFFKGKQASKVNLWLVDKYKASRKGEGKKPETINRELTVLRRMFNLAVQRRDLQYNPIKGMKLAKVAKKVYQTFKPMEIQKLYESAAPHLKPIILCACLTGMRRAELRVLMWADVDLYEGYIHIRKSKNNESRLIPIGETLIGILDRLKQNAKSEHVFTTQEGLPYFSRKSWEGAWKKAIINAGIKYRSFHVLRHTFVSNLIVEEKEDYATVMAISGHRDMRMLQRYSHTREEAKKSAVNKLEKRFKSEVMDTYLDTKVEKCEATHGKVIGLTNLE